MLRTFIPIILIILSIVGFFVLVEPMFGEIRELRAEAASYNKALDNSKALEDTKDKLTDKLNQITEQDLSRLEKMLPSEVDNIHLIVEIQEKIAFQHEMFLRDVQYNLEESNPDEVISGGTAREIINRDYGEWGLQFTVEGTYSDFILFLRDLESNLRLVDVVSIDFSSNTVSDPKAKNKEDVYKYSFKIKTYWLKN